MKIQTQSSADRITTSLRLAHQRKNKQTDSAQVSPYTKFTQTTGPRRTETKRKKEFNLIQGKNSIFLHLCIMSLPFHYYYFLVIMFVVSFSQASQFNSFFLLVSALLMKEIATHFSTLAWKIPWSGSLQFMGSQRVRHD